MAKGGRGGKRGGGAGSGSADLKGTTRNINPEWGEYDKAVARNHLANYGRILLDEYGAPIDNEYEEERIARKLKLIK